MKPNWPIKKLGEVLELCDSGTWGKESANGMPLLRSSNMQNGQLVLDDLKLIEVPLNQRDRYTLREGDILITKSSGSESHIGKCLYIPKEIDGKYGFSNFTQRLRPNREVVDPKWVYWILVSPFNREKLIAASRTTSGLRNLKMPALKEFEIPVPMIEEQKRIVTKLEKILGKIEKAKKFRLEAMGQAKNFAALSLRNTFIQLRKKAKTKVLGDLADLVNGRGFKRSEWGNKGLPIIRIENIHGSPNFNYYYGSYNHKIYVKKEDLLISWSGALVSVDAVIWNGPEGLLNQHIYRTVIKVDDVNKRFLLYAILEKLDELRSKVHGAVGLIHITKAKLEETEIPLISTTEQQKIVAYLDSLSEKVQNLQELQKQTQQELELLAQSVLHKAFRGEL